MAMIDVALLRQRASGMAIVKVCRKLARCEYSTPCRQGRAVSGEAAAPAPRGTPTERGCGEVARAIVGLQVAVNASKSSQACISAIYPELKQGCPSCGQAFLEIFQKQQGNMSALRQLIRLETGAHSSEAPEGGRRSTFGRPVVPLV